MKRLNRKQQYIYSNMILNLDPSIVVIEKAKKLHFYEWLGYNNNLMPRVIKSVILITLVILLGTFAITQSIVTTVEVVKILFFIPVKTVEYAAFSFGLFAPYLIPIFLLFFLGSLWISRKGSNSKQSRENYLFHIFAIYLFFPVFLFFKKCEATE
ncbi:MAG: hypothetical protein ACRC5H_06335, partial [Treponemataceae bacterium]